MIGIRAAQKALLAALLEPTEKLREAENAGLYADRLALMEEARTLPYAAVWNKICLDEGVPAGADWLEHVHAYEQNVLRNRV